MTSRLQTSDDLLDALGATPSLNLFPTENRMSPRALRALSCDAVHRYPTAEGPDFFYGDTLGLAAVYERCAELAREFFGARYAFVNLLSGLHAMHAVISSLCETGDRVFVMDPTCGGHYATGPICSGYRLDVEHLPFDRGSCLIDLDALERMAREKPPHLVYLDVSTLVRFPRVSEIPPRCRPGGDDLPRCFTHSRSPAVGTRGNRAWRRWLDLLGQHPQDLARPAEGPLPNRRPADC